MLSTDLLLISVPVRWHVYIPVCACLVTFMHACKLLSLSVTPLSLSILSRQIPRYILTLHELLAHTPHEHVERNSLDYAKSKLEELSRYNVVDGTVQYHQKQDKHGVSI